MTDERPSWARRVGVGERQPIDRVVADETRARTWQVLRSDGTLGGTQTEHRSGRVDALVFDPGAVMSRDEVEEIRRKFGMEPREVRQLLDRLFNAKGPVHG